MTDDRIDALLDRWEEAQRRGDDIPVEDLCRDAPDLVAAVRQRIELLRRVSWLAAPGDTPHLPAGPWGQDDEPLPGYRLVRRVGGGGFGQVWEAVGPHGRPCAVKVVPDRVTAAGGTTAGLELDGIERMLAVPAAGRLWVERCERAEGHLVVVTALADGTLADHLRAVRASGSGERVAAECVGHLSGVAEVLDRMAQEHGLLHGDVKPSNLLMVDGVCQVADFGTVARLGAGGEVLLVGPDGPAAGRAYRSAGAVPWDEALRPGVTAVTPAGPFTPLYAPPEVLDGRPVPASDQYALALTFCELAYGRLPWPGGHRLADRRAGAADLSFLPDPVRPVVRRALSPDPAARYPTCSALAAALSDAVCPADGG